MSPMNWKPWLVAGSVALLLAVPLVTPAQSLKQVMDAEQRRIRLSQESQNRIDAVVKQTRSLEDQYKALLKEIEGLNIYNTLLQRQVDNQKAQIADLKTSLDQVEVINRQIVPIMTKMIDGLEQFIELDVPFLIGERRERVAELRALMERQDVTVAEKFRKVTEAYQIENDFGRTIEAYKENLQIDDSTREVDMLRIGRIVLVYQTADGSKSGVWDQRSRSWQPLGSEYKNQIKFGLQIARKQVAPDLVLLPVDAPEAG